MTRAWSLCCALVLLAACERPFVDERVPEVEVLSPDVTTVQTVPRVLVQVRASSFRPIDRITLDGVDMTLSPLDKVWTREATLHTGLNRLVVSAIDVEGVASRDTLGIVFLPHGFTVAGPPLPAPRGSHTATQLLDGGLLVIGGAAHRTGTAAGDVFLLPSGFSDFERLSTMLAEPRAGHTATLLPDGRVLLVGGVSREGTPAVEDFIAAVELYDPVRREIRPVPYAGVPIQRAHHSAFLRKATDGRLLLDLFGGRGVIRTPTGPTVRVRSDLRTFVFRNDSLIALHDSPGPYYIESIEGQAQASLDDRAPGAPGPFLVNGSHFVGQGVDQVSFVIDYTSPTRPALYDAPGLLTPRTRHAAALLRPGYLLVVGGARDEDLVALDAPELYLAESGRFYRLASDVGSPKRWGLTATNLSPQRIMTAGGFGPDGNAVRATGYFQAAVTFSVALP